MTTPAPPLSPAAQAVLDAFLDTAVDAGNYYATRSCQIAAALRAAADQPYEVAEYIRGDDYWVHRNAVEAERDRLRAIAAELEQAASISNGAEPEPMR